MFAINKVFSNCGECLYVYEQIEAWISANLVKQNVRSNAYRTYGLFPKEQWSPADEWDMHVKIYEMFSAQVMGGI
jgi:hypothetical protein